MSKALEAGQWCKPRNEQEWKAVLDLAGTMGLGGHETGRSYPVAGGLGGYKLVSVISDPFRGGGVIPYRVVGGHYSLEGCLCVPSKKLSVPDFIAGMYALSEEKRVPNDTVGGTEFMLNDHEKRIEGLEKSVSATASVLDDAFEVDNMLKQRLEKLEAAFNEHLVKERENTK